MSFRLVSSALDSNGFLPAWYARSQEDASPPMGWVDPPRGTSAIAIICEETGSRDGRIHWVIYNLPPEPPALRGGLRIEPEMANGASQGVNSFGIPGWTGPEGSGGRRRLQFTAHALSRRLEIPPGSDAVTVRDAAASCTLGIARLGAVFLPKGGS